MSHTAAVHQTALSAKQYPVSARWNPDHATVSASVSSQTVAGRDGWRTQPGRTHVTSAAAAVPPSTYASLDGSRTRMIQAYSQRGSRRTIEFR